MLAIGLLVVACNGCEFSIGWVFSFLFGMGVVAGWLMGFLVGFQWEWVSGLVRFRF